MKPSSQGPGPQSTPIFVVALLLAAGAFWAQGPLETVRPRQADGIIKNATKPITYPQVDARLWQDPFGAVQRHIGKQQKGGATPGRLKNLQDECAKKNCLVMGVMVLGGPYVGMEERRRADRYAVLAGLQQDGFFAEDPEHISYVQEKITGTDDLTYIPFEWLTRKKPEKAEEKRLLLLWLDEDDFTKDSTSENTVLGRLNQVFKEFPAASLIGPLGSGTLGSMAKASQNCQHPTELKRVRIYSASATSDKAWAEIEKVKRKCEKTNPLTITRTIAKDDELAQLLADELVGQRHITGQPPIQKGTDEPTGKLTDRGRCPSMLAGACDAVLLMVQLDTVYSRNMIDLFTSKVEKDKGVKIKVAYYLRGIDGQLPKGDSPTAAEGKSDKDAKKDKSAIERPEGDAQIDYLRRLASEQAGQQGRDGWRIRAVGVVGNDYYDKLLVLKAMRPAFPDAVFFTTDLNAAMLHPDDNRVTRGMLVASGFGLDLHQNIQNGVPPFRMNYQTSTYLATRVALFNTLGRSRPDFQEINQREIEQRAPAMLFEIGRNTAVSLRNSKEKSEIEPGREWWKSVNWQPEYKSPLPVKFLIGMGLALISVFLLLRLLFTGFSEFLHEHRRVLIVAGVGAALFTGVIAGLWPAPLDEPFSWFEGISIWPTQILAAIALGMSLFLTHHGMAKLRKCDARAADEFGFSGDAESTLRRGRSEKTLQTFFLWQKYQTRSLAVSTLDKLSNLAVLNATPAWGWPTVLHQISTKVFFYAIVGAGLILAYGWPSVPARGGSFYLVWILEVSTSIALAVLLFFVLEASRRTRWLAVQLALTPHWPPQTLKKFQLPASQSQYYDHWLDVRLIAVASVATGRLVYYPFAVLFLMLVARSSFFDTWAPQWPDMLNFTLIVVLMLCAGLRLRRVAESVRSNALHKLHDQLLAVQGQEGKGELAAQIKTMIEQIRDTHMGVFLPFAQQPLVRAILGLVGGASGLVLLEYASLANF